MALLCLAVCLVLSAGNARAVVQYLDDGAEQNASGGWDLPKSTAGAGDLGQGYCSPDAAKTTRPECRALRITAADSTACTAAGGEWAASGGICDDPAYDNDQAGCEARPGRVYNANGKCAVSMKGHSRNIANCVSFGGVWSTAATCLGRWVMPDAITYTPPLWNGTTNPSTGDQCLRCHNTLTEWNSTDIRWVESFLKTGHKNMARKVAPAGDPAHGLPWAGPDGATYPSDDSGRLFDWVNGLITVSGTPREMTWIYGDWLAPLPRAIYKAPASASSTCSDPRPGVCSNPSYVSQGTCLANGGTWTSNGTQMGCQTNGGSWIANAGASYSCGRCHTTGWTSDATVNSTKEPERSFSGITWDRTNAAGPDVVNLSGGVSGDANKYSSWDVWGISCARCHNSVVDNPGCTTPPCNLSSPTGMGRHNNGLTAATGAACTDPRYTAQTQCEAAGGTWIAASGSTACTKDGNPLGTCDRGGACSDAAYVDKWNCEEAGEAWTTPADLAACTAAGGTWTASITSQYTCQDAGGRFTGTQPNRGQIITRLCMDCHRQEAGGVPYTDTVPAYAGDYDQHPGMYVKVGPAHGTVAPVSHSHGNMFLNSPHGEFTGTFTQIATATLGNGYGSEFQLHGEAANAGNGCTGCHDVHKSAVPEAGQEGAIHEECNECHSNISLTTINHLGGPGTPLEQMTAKACETCHMPEGLHFFRINTSASYSTYPMPAALNGTVNANTAPDGSFTNAVWVDVDHACGQCHGGGTAQTLTTGSISAGSAVLTVGDATNFAPGERVRVAGAGALEADGVTREDFESYVKSVLGFTVTLVGNASATVSGASVDLNPTRNDAPYLTKAQLAPVAEGMHDSAGVNYPVTFSATVGTPDSLRVDVDAQVTCGGPCPDFTYDWDWGDGSGHGSADPDSHGYAGGDPDPNPEKTITLTVRLLSSGLKVGSVSRRLYLFNPDLAPTVAMAGGACTWNPNTWQMSLVDASTDDGADADTTAGDGDAALAVSVKWGDGSTNSQGSAGATFGHTYTRPGAFTVTHRATDPKLQTATETCLATIPGYFEIRGTVMRSNGTTPVGYATVTVKKAGIIVKQVYTNLIGEFRVYPLTPGIYDITVRKTGYVFPVPPQVTVGPSDTTWSINATTP